MGKENILFVDNSRTIRATISKFLESKGYKITAVATGMQAMEQVRTGEYQLAILDLYMSGINGFDITERIRALHNEDVKNIPIIIYTSSQNEGDKDRCKKLGVNAYVLKSDGLPALMKSILQIIK